jgi:hypothetical protein
MSLVIFCVMRSLLGSVPQGSFQGCVEIESHFLYPLITKLAKERRWLVVLKYSAPLFVLIKDYPQRRVESSAYLEASHLRGGQRISDLILDRVSLFVKWKSGTYSGSRVTPRSIRDFGLTDSRSVKCQLDRGGEDLAEGYEDDGFCIEGFEVSSDERLLKG